VKTWLAGTYGLMHAHLRDNLQEMAHTHYEHAPAPKSLKHRYLVQDVGCDLVGAVSFARAAGVSTPVSDAAITLAGSLTKRDFMTEGRNLKRLGLHGLSPAQISERLSA
jgi:opine dehydrogenase